MSYEQVPIVLALDGMEPRAAMDLCRAVGWRIYGVKIHDMFDTYNCDAIVWLKQAGAKRVWVDYKLHDIPKTVDLRSAALRDAGADILTVHCCGDAPMIRAAIENGPPEVYAVTVLTSHDTIRCIQIFGDSASVKVSLFARMAAECGIHGIVCSPNEVQALRRTRDLDGVKLVTPGVRSPSQDKHDQARVSTPRNAIDSGADILVVGRQVTMADDPKAALQQIANEISLKDSEEES